MVWHYLGRDVGVVCWGGGVEMWYCVGKVILCLGVCFVRELCKVVSYNAVLFLYFIWN